MGIWTAGGAFGGAVSAVVVQPRYNSSVRAAAMQLCVQSFPDISYGPYAQNRLDIMRPRLPARDSRPAVVVFHGGAWGGGSRAEMRGRVCRRYLAKGFVTVNVEYRRGVVPAAEDACHALQWFFQNAALYGADPARIVVTGESAGAHLAMLAAFTSHVPVAATVNFYGISDLAALLDRPFIRAALPATEPRLTAERFSPIHTVRGGLGPVLSVHGTADTTVPLDQTTRLTMSLREVGNPDATQVLIEGGEHGFGEPELGRAYEAVFTFLQRNRVLRS